MPVRRIRESGDGGRDKWFAARVGLFLFRDHGPCREREWFYL